MSDTTQPAKTTDVPAQLRPGKVTRAVFYKGNGGGAPKRETPASVASRRRTGMPRRGR